MAGRDLLLVLPVAVAGALDADDVALVEKAVEDGRGAELIVEVVVGARILWPA